MTAFMPLAMEKDLRWLLMVTGSGSLSMRCTGVQDTMARQQRSCRLNTARGPGRGAEGSQTAGGAEVSQALGVPLPCTLDAQHTTPVAMPWQEMEASDHPGPSSSSGGTGLRLRDRHGSHPRCREGILHGPLLEHRDPTQS